MTHYKTLGVKEDATLEEIKKVYKKKAVIYHPDKASPENKKEYEQIFKDLTEAYNILSDNNKRKQYDMQRKGITRQGMNDIFRAFTNIHRPDPGIFMFVNDMRPMSANQVNVKQQVSVLPNGRRKIIKTTTRIVNGMSFQEVQEIIV